MSVKGTDVKLIFKMKKIFFSVIVAIAIGVGINSCTVSVNHCWMIGSGSDALFWTVDYFYGTAEEADAYILENYAGAYSKKKNSSYTEEECEAAKIN